MKHLVLATLAMALASGAAAQPATVGDDPRLCYAGAHASSALVDVIGLKDTTGTLRVEIYPAAKDDFLKDFDELKAEGKAAYRVQTPVTGPEMRVCIRAPGPGRWSVAVIHSRGGRRKFDWHTDGAGFANNPGFVFGKPDWDKTVATFGMSPISLRIAPRYLRGLGMHLMPGVTP